VGAANITALVTNPPKAAADLIGQVPGEERQALEQAAVAAARSLYPKLAEEVSDTIFYWDLSPRERAILPHLQDFLVWTRTRPSGQVREEDRWILSYPLFFNNTGARWPFWKLKEFVDTGQAVYHQPGVGFEVLGEGRVALRGAEPALLARLFPDAVFEAVPDKPGVMRMTRPIPAPAEPPPPSEKPVAPVPTPAALAPEQTVAPPDAEPKEPSPPPPPTEKPAAPAPRKKVVPVPGSLMTQSGGDPAMLKLAHDILLDLRGRRGMKLPGQGVPPLRLQRLFSGQVLDIGKAERWDVNYAHPLMKTMLGSALPDADKAAFMASLVYTAANRKLASVTDLDDVKFQQALADHLAEERAG
jgi:hypothetical protein